MAGQSRIPDRRADGMQCAGVGTLDELRYVDAGRPAGAVFMEASAAGARYSQTGKADALSFVDGGSPAAPCYAGATFPDAPGVADPVAPARRRFNREMVTDLVARATIVALFTLLSVNLFADFMRTGHVTGLLLLAGESLVVVLTIMRRRARLVDRSFAAAVMTAVSVAGPPMLRATGGAAMLPDIATAMISAVGLVLVVVGKMALGRSFGVAPANRGVVVRGPYTWVRHPIYTGYLITHVAFFMANPHPWNAAVIVIADVALVVRALMEERVLSADAEYQGYCQRVGWHLVPGVF